jgi:hypothetical protein
MQAVFLVARNSCSHVEVQENRMESYDVAVAYRIYPKMSKPTSALPFGNDKHLLSEVCLKSFKDSLAGLRTKMWVLLDGCPPEYRDLFLQHFRAEDLVFVELDHVGNQATFEKQIDILLSQQDAEVVYFAEDDYFYLPAQFSALLRFLSANPAVHFVSPYDHPDCFRMELHRGATSLTMFERRYWSSAGSTCLTFLTTRGTLRKTQHVFRTYTRGNHDSSLWLSLSKRAVFSTSKVLRCAVNKEERGQARIVARAWLQGWRQILFGRRWNLWMPIPGIATHLDAGGIPPSVDWIPRITKQVEALRISSLQGE